LSRRVGTIIATILGLSLLALVVVLFDLPGRLYTGHPEPVAPAAIIPTAQVRTVLQELLRDDETLALLESLLTEVERERMTAAVTARLLDSPDLEAAIIQVLRGPEFRQAVSRLLQDPEFPQLVRESITIQQIEGLASIAQDLLSSAEGQELLAAITRELLPLIRDR